MSGPVSITVIDTHTGGEPTRVVIAGGPELGGGTLAQRRAVFAERFDRYRSAVVNEPRGSDVMVGALLCKPDDAGCATGVIYFNNVGYLNMCGHGTIGLAVALKYLDRIGIGTHRIDTPVGPVSATLHDANTVSIQNVDSYRYKTSVSVDVPGIGSVIGDIAWGGNWFFLVGDHEEQLTVDRAGHLTDLTLRIRAALDANGIRGEDGGEIDHVELFGPPSDSRNHSRNFVMCPGGAYDRSPCGTGTSAKVACLAADGKLAPGDVWRQESIVGSVFEGSYQLARTAGRVIPTIKGSAYVNGEAKLRVDPDDPFDWGIGQ